MNSLLPRGMPKREQPMPCNQANDAEIGLFAGLISVDTALGARNKLKAVENWPTGWFFCKLLGSPTTMAGAQTRF
ncbi:MAG: hypothetical protein ACK46L_05885 [Synechococcaceae cyanobacterium]